MKKITVALAIICTLIPSYVSAEWPHNHYQARPQQQQKQQYQQQAVHDNYNYNRKGANFEAGYGNLIIGYPVTDLGLKYYYAVKDPYREPSEVLNEAEIEKLSERIADKTASRVVAKLLDQLKNGGGNTDTPTSPSPTTPTVPSDKKVQLEAKITTLFTARCYTCHASDTKSAGGYTLLVNNKLGNFSREQRWDIFDAVDSQKMPQSGDPLSIQEIEDVRDWARLK
jgi:mono/diheme cytochrome c family protein